MAISSFGTETKEIHGVNWIKEMQLQAICLPVSYEQKNTVPGNIITVLCAKQHCCHTSQHLAPNICTPKGN